MGTVSTEPMTPARVLLVDDVPLFREAIASLVDAQDDFAVVGRAGNGVEGVEQAARLQPDLVLLDVEMPTMGGLEALPLIRERSPRSRVLMLTVVEDDENLLGAIRAGAQGYLLKDLRPEELFVQMRAALRDESPVTAGLVGRLVAELRAQGRRTTAATAPLPEDMLSHRELQILQLAAQGLSNKEIGQQLSITEGTVKNHVHNSLAKLGMDNRVQAAAYIVRQGLGAPGPGHGPRP